MPTPDINKLDEILFKNFGSVGLKAIDDAKTALTQLLLEARESELRLLAKKLADRKPRETWKAWAFRVTDEMKQRLAELKALKKGKS